MINSAPCSNHAINLSYNISQIKLNNKVSVGALHIIIIHICKCISSVTSSYKGHNRVIPALWFHSEGHVALAMC
jgi:hypothetical protein